MGGVQLISKINEAMPIYIFESDIFASMALPEMQKFCAFKPEVTQLLKDSVALLHYVSLGLIYINVLD